MLRTLLETPLLQVPFTLVAVSCAPIQHALLATAAGLRAKLMHGKKHEDTRMIECGRLK
jgi:hypothetical protein